jgi:ubiquinone/menaquinone biosynthesis C-methylase UbiE
MTEKKRLTHEDFSCVWKDDNNKLESGLTLDLVQHLSRQRLLPEWVDAKKNVIQIMKLDQFDNSQEIQILDIGCGLGIDLLLVAEEATRLNKRVSIVGLDQNSTMVEEAKKLYDSQKERLSPDISIRILRGDILQMEFADETFDIVRSDITLQHVDIPKAVVEIKRVLKTNGRLIALEGGMGNVFSSDEVVMKVYENILPSTKNGGPGIRLQFILPTMNFDIKGLNPKAFIQTGQILATQDKDWIKLRGLGEMFVAKHVLTEEESQDFQKRYIQACETNQIVSASILYIIEAVKCE